jgi:hypothetical protein
MASALGFAMLMAGCSASELPDRRYQQVGECQDAPDPSLLIDDASLRASMRLTEEQRAQLEGEFRAIRRERREMESALERIRFASLEARAEFVRKFRDRANVRIRAILTEAQWRAYACASPAEGSKRRDGPAAEVEAQRNLLGHILSN